jgi:ectoine hydroxylase-related dioxygenase (phytanoyl-CoA dioxygenase family)
MSVRHLPASISGEEVAAILEEDGVVVVDNLVTTEYLDDIAAELKPWIDATRPGPDDFAGRRTRRTGGLIARSPKCREIVMHPLVLAACDKFLGHATSFQLHLTQVIAIGPGEPMQAIHRDQWAFDFFPFPKGYEVQCNTIWAMTDFTAKNGATRVIPGSNKFDDKLKFEEKDTEPAEMSKGSVLFYSGSIYHGGGANHSDATRVGINITYNVSWLRQEENQYLAVPLEVARTLPVDLLKLMGYRRGAYALGYVDDLRDPIEIVRPDLARTGLGDLDEVQKKLRKQGAQFSIGATSK